MDKLETPYDEDADFIECKVCEKFMRGETLYKIHVTTPGHIKKEDCMVAAGRAIRRRILPEFTDIIHYLDYLKLDEPIIGLSYLDEVPCSDSQMELRYTCRLCQQTLVLAEMVRHVIGRKHRQKYVELKRPDLVTWDKQSSATQGKIIRTRAEIIERQDGRGIPVSMPKKKNEGTLKILGVPPKQKQNRDQRIQQQLPRDVPPLLPELKNYRSNLSQRRKQPPGNPNMPAFHPDEPDGNRDRWRQLNEKLGHGRMEEKLQRADYRESYYGQEYMDSDYRSRYEEEYVKEPQKRAILESGDVPRYDYREEMPHGLAQDVACYPGEAPPYKRPYPERDPLKEFYSEEVNRGRVRSELQPSQLAYPEGDKQRWSLERDSGGHDGMNRESRQGSGEPEAKRRNFFTSMESDRPHEHLFHIIKDYQHEMRAPPQEEVINLPGPSRGAAPPSRRVEVTRTISDIPEPFRIFLNGANNVEEHGKRKRKSRFSDATPEELEMTKDIYSDEYGPFNSKFGGDPRPVGGPLRPETSETQYSDFYGESQSSHLTERYQRGGSESEGVFDMLKNIEIENAQEADFLKDRLCSLLKEFKSKKLEKAAQSSQGRAGVCKNYDDLELDPELSRYQFERILREDSDHRQAEDSYFKDDHRSGWKQLQHTLEERHQDYHHPLRGEPRHRSCYEEVFGTQPPNSLSNPSRYPERFQEPMPSRDYQPAAEEFFDSQSSAPPLCMEQGPRMHRGPRYSNNLDKITSTLLELVAKK